MNSFKNSQKRLNFTHKNELKFTILPTPKPPPQGRGLFTLFKSVNFTDEVRFAMNLTRRSISSGFLGLREFASADRTLKFIRTKQTKRAEQGFLSLAKRLPKKPPQDEPLQSYFSIALFKSAIKSSALSSPTLKRTVFGVMPALLNSASLNCECVVE